MNAPTDEHKALARLVLETLDTQQRYFSTRAPQVLEQSKRLEKALREKAVEALSPPQARLFT